LGGAGREPPTAGALTVQIDALVSARKAHLARRHGSLGTRASRRPGGCSRAGWRSLRPAVGGSLPAPIVESFEGHISCSYVVAPAVAYP